VELHNPRQKPVSKEIVGALSYSRKEAQQAASSPFFFDPCLVRVSSGCSTRSSGSMVSMIVLKSVG
jgi:hypothetical protein